MNSNIENTGLKKLKEAFREINQWEYENLHLDTLEEVIPSPRYQKRMERLIKRQNKSYWKYVNTVGKRVAVLAVVLMLTFALSMSVSAVREPIVEFFVNVYEKFVEFFYDEADVARAPEKIEKVYTLGYVPKGYELEQRVVFDKRVKTIWKNSLGDTIVFSQLLFENFHSMDSEFSNYKRITIFDIDIAFIEKNNNYSFYWNSNEYAYSLIITETITVEECIMLIESIIVINE